jgi:hypothetical protein
MVKMGKRMKSRIDGAGSGIDNGVENGNDIRKVGQVTSANSLVEKDSPDDFSFEGSSDKNLGTKDANRRSSSTVPSGDDAYVTVDNPDDFE